MTENPYSKQPARSFWRTAISEVSALEISNIFNPRVNLSKTTRIAAAGSCFAQHIGTQFKRRGYNFIDLERPPQGWDKKRSNLFGLNMYSARYGNIYSIRQFRQLLERASGDFTPDESVWEKDGRFFDPFRPSIEPNGFCSKIEMENDREYHLSQVNTLLEQSDLLVFTFGLTEAWECISDGAILPTCPGTVAGEFDDKKYAFKNFTFNEVLDDAKWVISLARRKNPDIQFLFTVSPVPLTATATDDHVLAATVYSKSVLRAVCGELRMQYDYVDYFPSYELVSSHPLRAMYFDPNLRTVADAGVLNVMNAFFSAFSDNTKPNLNDTGRRYATRSDGRLETRSKQLKSGTDPVCDEELLEGFGP